MYARLGTADRERLYRNCFWIQHAHRVHLYSRSAFFMALITAIEALIGENETSPKPCPTCKRPVGAGPTKRFVEFVEQFAPGGEMKERRRQLYAMRSTLSHGGTLLRSDRRRDFMTLNPEDSSELGHIGIANGIVRVTTVNWLISRGELSA